MISLKELKDMEEMMIFCHICSSIVFLTFYGSEFLIYDINFLAFEVLEMPKSAIPHFLISLLVAVYMITK